MTYKFAYYNYYNCHDNLINFPVNISMTSGSIRILPNELALSSYLGISELWNTLYTSPIEQYVLEPGNIISIQCTYIITQTPTIIPTGNGGIIFQLKNLNKQAVKRSRPDYKAKLQKFYQQKAQQQAQQPSQPAQQPAQ